MILDQLSSHANKKRFNSSLLSHLAFKEISKSFVMEKMKQVHIKTKSLLHTPFFDNDISEFALSLPLPLRNDKYLLKQYLLELTGNNDIFAKILRRKHGFGVDYRNLLIQFGDNLYERISDSRFIDFMEFDKKNYSVMLSSLKNQAQKKLSRRQALDIWYIYGIFQWWNDFFYNKDGEKIC
jgi:hypothetical protein